MRIKIILPLALLILSFYACTKDNDDSKKVIIDYATYSTLTNWKEIESKTDATSWVAISNGNTLSIFSNPNPTGFVIGEYLYKAANSKINIDSSGFIQQTDSLVNFISKGFRDTTTLTYKIYGDSLLVINNASVSPATEIKYRKLVK